MGQNRREFLKSTGALVVAGAAAGPAVARRPSAMEGNADALLRTAVESGEVPGVVAMATTRNSTIYEGAFGARVLGQAGAMALDSVVWLASMTKPIVGAAAMQLVEQGRLDLDGPAARFVPELERVQVLEGWTSDGAPRLRDPKRPVTLRHLLTHTSGFSYEIWSADIRKYQSVTSTPGILSGRNAALTTPLVFDPGERWEYGIGIDHVGKAIENASGQRLSAYLQDHIFEPLGMRDTAFRIRPDMRARLARIHQRDAAGRLAATDIEIPQYPEFEMGGGGLYGTAGDYLRFVRMILNDGDSNGVQVLKPSTVVRMSRNAIGRLRVRPLRSVVPPLSNDAEYFPGMPKRWGLTFMINEQRAPTGRAPGSLAWGGLANTHFWIDRRQGVAGVYLTQVLPFADVRSLPLFYAFEKTVYDTLV